MAWAIGTKQLRELARRIRGSRGIDNARVVAMRRQLDSGEYQISSAAIADALMAMEEALGAKDRPDSPPEE